TRLVDARGVSKLYKTRVPTTRLLPLFLAALMPMALVYRFSTWFSQIVDLLIIRLRVLWRML
ncbi:MAG: SteA domain-containing protein, partial [Bacillota bacterium]